MMQQSKINRRKFLLVAKIFIMLLFSIPFASTAQVKIITANNTPIKINPLLLSAFKKQVSPNPLLAERVKPYKHELMYWPDFYLTAQQIQYRNNNLNQSVATKIAQDIVSNYVNNLLYGKKMPVAVTPRF